MGNPRGRPRVENPKRNKTLKLADRTHKKLAQLKLETGLAEAVIVETLIDDINERSLKKKANI